MLKKNGCRAQPFFILWGVIAYTGMPFFERIAKWIIACGVVLLALSPFFVSPETAFPAVFLRTIVVRIAIEIMVLVYLFLALFFPKYRPKKSTIAYAVALFLFVFLLSTLFGINPYRSFWGSHERMEGYVTVLHFGALFLVLFGTFQKPEEYKKVLWASLLVSVAQSFYAFGQLPFINIESTKLYANETSRISGTFGNATILALYLIFQIFFAAMLFFWTRARWLKGVLIAIFLIDAVAVFFSGTRGAMLGMLTGILLLAAGHIFFSGKRMLRIAGALCIALLMGSFGVLYIFRGSDTVRNNYILQRAMFFDSAVTTITSRSTAWKIGFEGWKERFWLGYGMENFNYVFNRFYNPIMLYYDPGDFDRPHNRFVDSVVTGGFFGIVSHVAVFVTAAWFLFKKWLGNRKFFFPLAGLALLAAYATQLLTLFDHMISYQFFAIALALFATWQAPSDAGTASDGKYQIPNTKPQTIQGETLENKPEYQYVPVKIAALVLAVIGMARFAWAANVVPLEASYYAQVATNTNYASQGKGFREAFGYLKQSFDRNTYLNVDMRLALSGFATSQARGAQGDEKEFGREVLEYMAAQFEKNLTEHHPDIKDFLAHTTYARIAQSLSEYDSTWNDKALAVLKAGVEEYPKKYQLIQSLTRTYMQQGNVQAAIDVFEAHPLEMQRGDFYFDYAAALYSVGRNEDAWTQIERTMKAGYDFSKNLPKLVDILLKDKQVARVARVYEHQLTSTAQAGDTQLMASLAETYRTMGDIPNARKVAEKLREVDPEHTEEIEAFLRELEQPIN